MPTQTKINLTPAQFSDLERPLADFGPLSASGFRFSSGVCAVRLQNELGELLLLPFQGQQIWSAAFDGRTLTMRSMFSEPRPTREFLATFGGFLQHCGLSGVGGPTAEDSHVLHGELPNAPYQRAWLVSGRDERGAYIGLGGAYQHTVAFGPNYLAEPLVRLSAGGSLFPASMTLSNLARSPRAYGYLAHVNFRPVDNGRLVYSAPATPEHVRVRATIPSHIKPGPGYADFLAELKADPRGHELLKPGLAFDPEVVFFIDYLAGPAGWAASMQIHPDGQADLIRHRPAQLPRATRWISRTPDQDAIALVEAGTCEPEGYLAEKAKGNIKMLPPGEKFVAELEIGALAAEQAARVEADIRAWLG